MCCSQHRCIFLLYFFSLPMPPQPPLFQSFDCLLCDWKCCSSGSLLKHQESKHPNVTLPEEATCYTQIHHPHINGVYLAIIFHIIFDIHELQGKHALLMDHFCQHQFLNTSQTTQWMLHQKICGLLLKTELPLILLSTITLNFSCQRVKLQKDWIYYVLWALSMVLIMVHCGNLQRICMPLSTLFKLVVLHGKHPSFGIQDLSRRHHLVGWMKSMNSIFRTFWRFLKRSLCPLSSKMTAITLCIRSLIPKVIVFGQTSCLVTGHIDKQ